MKKQLMTFVKISVIGGIIGFLLILNTCIGGKLSNRKWTQEQAVYDINVAAGGYFQVSEVLIGIPWIQETVKKNSKGENEIIVTDGTMYFAPERMNYYAKINTQIRTIGIYDSPIFTADLSINGVFNLDIPENKNGLTYKTNEAFLVVDIGSKSIICQPEFEINGTKYKTYYASNIGDSLGITSKFDCSSSIINFSTDLRIRGAEEFYIFLSSPETTLKVDCDWKSPAFKYYTYLPVAHEITDEGFTAEWNVPFDVGDCTHNIGFKYVQPVNIYKMLERAVNYGFLFIIVPFIILFLFEIFLSINLHPLNYLLCGAASVIFFLMLLSISEHISFTAAYIISALGSGILVSFYVASITQKIKLGFTMSFVFVLMYGFLFLSLQSEDYALLIGSLFAFMVLALIMFFTRKVDWSNLKKDKIEEIHE